MRTTKQLPFWERAKILIRAHKISQEKFAAYVGVNLSTLKYWICYGLLPDVEIAINIADALGVSVEFLVRGTDGKSLENRKAETLLRKNAAKAIKAMAQKIEESASLIG
jgi:transcriptional regulator with XRE-family HTH domain